MESHASWALAPPLIAIACDVTESDAGAWRATCPLAYSESVARAGGLPMLFPPIEALIRATLESVDGLVLTGGADPRTEPFGQPTHHQARPVSSRRQSFETALLRQLDQRPDIPVLGVCLGMQMMALSAGGKLNQHLPDNTPTADQHRDNARHPIQPTAGSPLPPGRVASFHHQAVEDPGTLRVIATAHDGVVEAIDDPTRPFYLGVQWHPERTEDAPLGIDLFRKLVKAAQVRACRRRTASGPPD